MDPVSTLINVLTDPSLKPAAPLWGGCSCNRNECQGHQPPGPAAWPPGADLGDGRETLPAWGGVLLQPGLPAGVEPVPVLKAHLGHLRSQDGPLRT